MCILGENVNSFYYIFRAEKFGEVQKCNQYFSQGYTNPVCANFSIQTEIYLFIQCYGHQSQQVILGGKQN